MLARNKDPVQIRYRSYCTWEVEALVDGEEPKYTFPPSVLAFLRSLVPENIKGDILHDAYKVSIHEFCKGIDLPFETIIKSINYVLILTFCFISGVIAPCLTSKMLKVFIGCYLKKFIVRFV